MKQYGIKSPIIPVEIPKTSHISVLGSDTNLDSSYMSMN